MVKEVTLDCSLEECTAQKFYDVVYAGEEATRRYHLLVHKTEQIEVTPWEDGKRVVECTMPVKIPETLKTMLGGDRIPIVDTQDIVFMEEGEFEVSSTPILQIPGGSKYTTSAKVTVSNSETGCQIVVVVTCSAAGPWGMISFIEGIMAEQARVGMEGFLEFCKGEIFSRNVSLEGGAGAEEVRSIASLSDEFFDLQETLSEASNSGSLHTALTKGASLGMMVDSALSENLQKLLKASEKMQRKLDDLSKRLDNWEKVQSGRSRTLYFISGCCVVLLWLQIKPRK
ncbi:hypothetical protein BSKO_07227 [Bryopsis sp. KO-2023]|nr:hypothetical protein BSKO_07227 [Bryopsis sp. KO-2023]